MEKDTNKKMGLNTITKGGVKLPLRLVAYGPDGIGKSSFAAESPSPIFVCTESGATRINVPQFPLCRGWPDIFDALTTLGT